MNPSPRGERRNRLRRRIGRKPKYYPRNIGLDIIKSNCTSESCTHPSHNQIIKGPGTTLPSGACHSAHIAPTPPHCSPKVLDGVRSGHPSRSGRGLHSWAESTGRVASYPACSARIQQTPAFSADNQASPIQEATATVSRTISALDLRTFTYRQSPGQAAFETLES